MQRSRAAVALAFSFAAALVAPGQAQLFTATRFLARGAHSFSSSVVVSSSSWQHGDHVHERVHSMRSEVVQNGPASQHTRSEVLCQDGLCQQTTHVSRPPLATWLRLPGLHGLLRGRVRPDTADVPQVVAMVVPAGPPPVVMRAAAPPVTVGHSTGDMLAAYIAVAAGALAMTGVIMRQLGSAAAAREPSLRVLGEPLAPAAEPGAAAALAGEGWQAWVEEAKSKERAAAAAVAAATSAKSFLSDVYVRAAATTDAKATKAYLLRVFERALA